MNEINEIKIELFGRVQGIRFRNTIKELANKLKIKGFVFNLEKGGVCVLGQGSKNNLLDFITELQKNPGLSKIKEMNYKWQKPEKIFSKFDIIKKDPFLTDKAKSFLNLGKQVIAENLEKVPTHLAIIPDGNRRWAKERKLPPTVGHKQSGNYKRLISLFKESKDLGIKYISFWGFSTENWKRDKNEKDIIFKLIQEATNKFLEFAKEHNIRFRHIGRKDRLPKELINALENLEKETKNNKEFNVQICLDYGGRDEIIRTINKILKSGIKQIDETFFLKCLDTGDIPEPDLIVRTSGENRVSGFMPFQGTYSELYFTNTHYPDFGKKELRKAIQEFSNRKRRFGGN
ncbi:MAG: polyprenyl diphosphate synthase [Candidatus Nanoarchaeia archaeon]